MIEMIRSTEWMIWGENVVLEKEQHKNLYRYNK